MSLPRFTYLSPRSLKDASALLVKHGDKARLMAGGTDLLIKMRHRALMPEYLIGLRGLPGLETLRCDRESGLVIGALSRLADVAGHPEIRRYYPALSRSANLTATVQVRNMGTVVGNICNAAPSADNACPLLAYDAEAVIVHPGGERRMKLIEFFRGPGLTALEPGEIVKELRADQPGPRNGSDYQKISARSHVDIAAVSVAASLDLDEEGRVVRPRLALGAVAPIPMRARRAEKALNGRAPDADLIRQAAGLAAEECTPISDVRATAAYRRRMVAVLAQRALDKSLAMARQRQEGCEP